MFDSSQIISKVSSQIQKGIWFWDGIPWTEVFRPCMAFFEYNEILSPEVFHSIHLVSLGSASELQPVQAGGPTHRPRAQQAAGTWCRISPTPTPSHRGRSGSTEGPGLWCSCHWAEMEWHLGPCSAVLLGQARKGTWGGLWQSMSCWPGADCQTIGRPQSCENRFLAFWIIFSDFSGIEKNALRFFVPVQTATIPWLPRCSGVSAHGARHPEGFGWHCFSDGWCEGCEPKVTW